MAYIKWTSYPLGIFLDIEYYELTLTYYDDKDKTNNATHKHTINQFNTADYVYYYLLNNDTTNVYAYSDGHITYNKIQDMIRVARSYGEVGLQTSNAVAETEQQIRNLNEKFANMIN